MATDKDLPTPSSTAPPGIDAGFWRHAVPADMRSWVTDIVGYEERTRETNHQIETASLTVPLILSFGEPFEIGLGHRPTAENAVPSFLAGLSSKPVYICSRGRAKCLQINFTPPGARRFFGLPMNVIADRMEPVTDLEDRELAAFVRQTEDLPNWPDRLRHALLFVRDRLLRNTSKPGWTVHAYRRILDTGGRVTVGSLVAETGWSRKHLGQKFQQEIGLSPKSVARIVRFGNVVAHAGTGTDVNWSALAYDCGYSDQAHLIREFAEFSGTSPTAWLARVQGHSTQAW